MNLYVHSTAPWSPSSYSVLVNRSLPQMVRDGHKVTLGTWYGLQGQPLPWLIQDKDGKAGGKVTVLPTTGNNYSIDTIEHSYKFHKSDALITISDVWVFPENVTKNTLFCPWLPIDHDPAPKPVLDSLKSAVYPMAMSQFGVDTLANAGVKAKYVPGSAPTSIFKPGDKSAARKEFEVADDIFLVSMVAANKDPMDRKGFAEAIAGFAEFVQAHENARLYLHTNWAGTVNIPALLEAFGINEKVLQPDAYAYRMGMFNEEYMANVYRASDVLLNPCKSEGFGLPLVEAQMCGCPVAVTDFATTDELLFAGWRLEGQPDWSNGQNSWRKRVYIKSIVDALEDAYKTKGNRKLYKKAINGAKRYDTEFVYKNYWRPALKDIEAIVAKRKRYQNREVVNA